jgi:4'-phosphopantetheinyl transferase
VTIVAMSLAASDADVAHLEQLLSASERGRAMRCLPEVRRRFIVGRGRLRLLLSCVVGASPGSIDLHIGSHGKPELGQRHADRCHFNLTHSQDHGLVAFSRESPVGIDLERMAPSHTTQWAALMAGSILATDELQRWQGLPDPLKPAALLEHWVVKEAVLKACGRGIGGGLRNLSLPTPLPRITLPPEQEAVDVRLSRVVGEGIEPLGVGLLAGTPNAFAAIACQSPDCRLASTTFDRAVRESGGFC